MTEKFDQWAIVEIMGHQRLAGRVTEQTIGGVCFVRVDVPECQGIKPFTKLLGAGAVYAITVVDKETAMAAAEHMREVPIDEWSARQMVGITDRMLISAAPKKSMDCDGEGADDYDGKETCF